MRVLLALMLVLAHLASCADSQPSVLRVQGRGRHVGAKSGGRKLMCRCGGPPPPPPPPPPADCTDCANGKYLEASCDIAQKRDRVCTSCPSGPNCVAGEYHSSYSGCTQTSAGTCSTCPACPAGNYRSGCALRSSGFTIVCLTIIYDVQENRSPLLSSPVLSSISSFYMRTCMHSETAIHTCLQNTY